MAWFEKFFARKEDALAFALEVIHEGAEIIDIYEAEEEIGDLWIGPVWWVSWNKPERGEIDYVVAKAFLEKVLKDDKVEAVKIVARGDEMALSRWFRGNTRADRVYLKGGKVVKVALRRRSWREKEIKK